MLCFYASKICVLFQSLEITLITSQHLQDGWKLAMFLFFVFMDQETAFSKSIMDIVKKLGTF